MLTCSDVLACCFSRIPEINYKLCHQTSLKYLEIFVILICVMELLNIALLILQVKESVSTYEKISTT